MVITNLFSTDNWQSDAVQLAAEAYDGSDQFCPTCGQNDCDCHESGVLNCTSFNCRGCGACEFGFANEAELSRYWEG